MSFGTDSEMLDRCPGFVAPGTDHRKQVVSLGVLGVGLQNSHCMITGRVQVALPQR